jgi:predicted metal-dependent hydrolase
MIQLGLISLNLELAKKHPNYLELIVVHEMTHLSERRVLSRSAT